MLLSDRDLIAEHKAGTLALEPFEPALGRSLLKRRRGVLLATEQVPVALLLLARTPLEPFDVAAIDQRLQRLLHRGEGGRLLLEPHVAVGLGHHEVEEGEMIAKCEDR